MDNKRSFKGGLDLKFFPDPRLESLNNTTFLENAPIIARNVLRLLMMGWSLSGNSAKQLFSLPLKSLILPLLKAVFIERNPLLLKEVFLAFQQGFENLFQQVKGKKLNAAESEQFQFYLSNCFSLLPYAALTSNDSIKIPQCINEEWTLVEYRIVPIELTANPINNSVKDSDRIFAYGLVPLLPAEARSHLIFPATTYPADNGFLAQINADFEPFADVGFTLYKNTRESLKNFLVSQLGKVHVCGLSLGGIWGLLLTIDYPQYIQRVDVLNPPGLNYKWLFTNPYDHWDEAENKPIVKIQSQEKDWASLFGDWKTEWELIKVIPPKDKRGPGFIYDHFLNYAGFANTEFITLNVVEENKKRPLRNVLFFYTGRSLVYYLAIFPYTKFVSPWIVRPILSYIFPPNTNNNLMNTYQFTHAEVNNYYKVMRCLLRGKEFVPIDDKPSKHYAGTKKELLILSQNANHETLNLKMTTAKYTHIKNTLYFLKKLGGENSALKKAVEDDYQSYKMGKNR